MACETEETMPAEHERETARRGIEALNRERKGALPEIRARARQATDAGKEKLGRDLTTEANRLSRARTKAAAAQDRVLLATSLAGAIAELRGLTTEATEARRDLEQLGTALAAAQRLVEIFRRLVNVFS
jgi:hypothetical protein